MAEQRGAAEETERNLVRLDCYSRNSDRAFAIFQVQEDKAKKADRAFKGTYGL